MSRGPSSLRAATADRALTAPAVLATCLPAPHCHAAVRALLGRGPSTGSGLPTPQSTDAGSPRRETQLSSGATRSVSAAAMHHSDSPTDSLSVWTGRGTSVNLYCPNLCPDPCPNLCRPANFSLSSSTNFSLSSYIPRLSLSSVIQCPSNGHECPTPGSRDAKPCHGSGRVSEEPGPLLRGATRF